MDQGAHEGVNESVDASYCEAPAVSSAAAGGPPFAECVLCRKPTEYPESVKGITLCPVCEWQEAQRSACSG
ncbi:hypothetical protein EES39_22985 [Streptomyces sp. ADI92-24]|uniref:hypothetical protein n=1 Tax=Streptomyces TaxID=1883 RepID=UPI000F46A6DD|nr:MULTISPECIES: hypothetical protein [Streptomyces]MBO0915114.1 hypothetical protein [Streptomyces laculatispora]MCX4769072.1 hypothetical protein [Streptomyces sp. NBC_01285]ROQ76770.1 hypothetical protein EDD95_3243 [Streptomyces sp. CEV 2-1]RPK41046.1 hypothetical protein EES39_22985 [Streptomyces sp. ADI92-24]